MLMRTLLLITGILLAFSGAAEVYRSVDEDGNVVFTDQPSEGAEVIEIDKLQTIKPPPVRDSDYAPRQEKPKPAYTEIRITSPENDLAIRENSGNVSVSISTTPGLRPGDAVFLYLDGKEFNLGNSTGKSFTGLDRGTHQLRAVIKSSDGRILLSSKSVTFHLLRQSVIPAARAN